MHALYFNSGKKLFGTANFEDIVPSPIEERIIDDLIGIA